MSAFILSAIIFTVLYFFSTTVLISFCVNENSRISKALSSQISASMYEVMRRGWTREDLEIFLKGSQEAFADSSYTVEIYRSPVVEALYGSVTQKTPSSQVLESFKSGRIIKQTKAM